MMNPLLKEIALRENLPTPAYFYDLSLLGRTVEAIKNSAADPRFKVHYALKANTDPVILKILSNAGFGADTVSGGEIRIALENGFIPSRIVYAGVGKSDAEIDYALDVEIGCFNVESLEELEVIAERAKRKGKKAPVALRVNPEIDAHTHHFITTGLAENKFGIPMSLLDEAVAYASGNDSLDLRGLHFHIGSQVTIAEPFVLLSQRINELQKKYEAMGVKFATINVGGGLGIDYEDPDRNPIPDFKSYFDAFAENLDIRSGQEIHFELGRSVVAQCGSLLTKCLFVKKGVEKRFVITDAGFTDLIRPAFYGAYHKIENLTSTSNESEIYDVVGPICESSDVFGEKISLPMTHRGDILALRSAGAYGAVMAMQYNGRALPSAIYSE